MFTCSGSAPVINSTNSSTVYGEIGGALSLVCTTNDPNDIISWYFNNEPMSLGTGKQLGVLLLPTLRVEYGGWYTCAAANAFGRDEEDFLVVVGRKYPSPLLLLYIYSSYAKADLGLHVEGYYVFHELFLPVAHALLTSLMHRYLF